MQFWSKGLGKRSMGIDCGTERVEVQEEKMILHGKTRPPLNWQYAMEMGIKDWEEFFQVAFHPEVVKYLLYPGRWTVARKAGTHLILFLVRYISCLLWPLRVAKGVGSGEGGQKAQ